MRRLQPLVAVLVLVGALAAATYADRGLGPTTYAAGEDGPAVSGAWSCPHGGGPEGWEIYLQIANPGPDVATVRIRDLSAERPSEDRMLEIQPGTFERVAAPAEGRGRSTYVEWFGQWVAVGWIAHAGGEERGVAAEPCAPAAGDRWFLPDGSTEIEGNEEYVVVMNPFARPAVFSLTLLSERKEPVEQGELTDVVLKPFRSKAFHLNAVVLGERTVSTLVEVSVGRVAAASLGVAGTGGIRSALGYLGQPAGTLTFPGGADAGRTELVVMNAADPAGTRRVQLAGDILGPEGPTPFAGLAEASLPPGAARTFPATTSGASAVQLTVTGDDVAAVRRTYGVVSDQASITGAEPAARWIVLPSVIGPPSEPGLVLANPGSEPAVITLSYLQPGPTTTVQVTVQPGTAVQAPKEFRALAPEGAVVAEATTGTFVPAAVSYSQGPDGLSAFAASLGIALPA